MKRVLVLIFLFFSVVGAYLWIASNFDRNERTEIVLKSDNETLTKTVTNPISQESIAEIEQTHLFAPLSEEVDDPEDRSFIQAHGEAEKNDGDYVDADDRSFVHEEGVEQNVGAVDTELIFM